MKQIAKKLIAGVVLAGLLTTASSQAMFSRPVPAPKSSIHTMVKIGVPLAFLTLAGFVAFYFINWLNSKNKKIDMVIKKINTLADKGAEPLNDYKTAKNIGSTILNGFSTVGNGIKYGASKTVDGAKYIGSFLGNLIGKVFGKNDTKTEIPNTPVNPTLFFEKN